jgi:hypothetical protein
VALGYDADNDRYLVADEDGAVFRVNAATGAVTQVINADSTALSRPGAFAFAGTLGFFAYDNDDGSIDRVRTSFTVTPVLEEPSGTTRGGGNQGALVYHAASGRLFQSDIGIHGILEIDVNTGERVVISR